MVATHHGLRAVNDIPRNMPDSLLKKLAAKGGVIGFQLGNEFHNRKAFEWATAHAGKAFWDTSAILQRGTQIPIYEIDKIVGPQFPMLPAEIPQEIRLTVDEWVGVVDRAIELVGEDHVSLGSDFDGGPPLPRGMRDIRDLPMITDAMLRRGYSEERIRKFLGGNLLRVFRQITEEKAAENAVSRIRCHLRHAAQAACCAQAAATDCGGFRVASHRPASDARAEGGDGENHSRVADAAEPDAGDEQRRSQYAAMRTASRSRNSRRLSRTPPRQTRLPRRKAKYATFHQLPCFASSARKWLLAAMMARNWTDTYTLSARLRGGS